MQFDRQTHNSDQDRESSHSTTHPVVGRIRPLRSEVLALQRSAGNAAVARLLSAGEEAVRNVVGQGGGRPLDVHTREDRAPAAALRETGLVLRHGPAPTHRKAARA